MLTLNDFFGSLKSECLDRLILFGEKAMRNAVNQYLAHYHAERPHQGLGNKLIVPLEHPPVVDANIESNERLRGAASILSPSGVSARFLIVLSRRCKTIGLGDCCAHPSVCPIFYPRRRRLASNSTENPGLPSDTSSKIVGQSARLSFLTPRANEQCLTSVRALDQKSTEIDQLLSVPVLCFLVS